jgi:hypothetical protein
MNDSKDTVLCQSFASELSDGNRLEGPVFKLSGYKGDAP